MYNQNIPSTTLISSGLTLKMLSYYAWYAMEAYCFLGRFGPGIYGTVSANSNEIVLKFRGTEMNIKEWNERPSKMINYPGVINAKIDKTFYEIFSQSKNTILSHIDYNMKIKNYRRIIAVGHGVGGVYATLALLEFWKLRKDLELLVVTFGQPQIGNREFAKYMSSIYNNVTVIRVTHTDDYIPRMPRNAWGTVYEHQPVECWLDYECDSCQTQKIQHAYWCHGEKSLDQDHRSEILFAEESDECNKLYAFPESKAHNGPYFDVPMGKCLDSNPPWEVETWNDEN